MIRKKDFDPKIVRKINDEDRMWFVEQWANYVRTCSDKEWSKQQNVTINSQMQNARHYKISPKEYLTIKGEKCTRK